MWQRFRNRLIFIVMLLALSACSAAPSLFSGAPVAVTSGEVLFRDDFSDTSSGWTTWDQDGSIIAYHDDGLRFIINEAQYDFWSRAGKNYEDIRLEVLATLIGGSTDNDFGLICRYQDDDHFYGFLVSSDGYTGIVKVSGGVYQVISAGTLEYNEVVARGQAANYLRADCVGSHLTLYVNDQKVAEAEDEELTGGDVGLMAGTYSTPGVDILFDNFVALKP